jgi:hypothetical protein
MRSVPIGVLFVMLAAPAWGFDANGVALGATEADVLRQYPSARCRPLEWKSDAAQRRCDDAKAEIGGAQARITFFLKGDAVQAFDVRFDAQHLERVLAHLKERFGKPVSETREKIERRRETRELYKVRWERGADRAVLTSQIKRRRVDLNVWRGNFDTEIYRIR